MAPLNEAVIMGAILYIFTFVTGIHYLSYNKSMICGGKKSDGSSCGAYSMSTSRYCFTHDPASKDRHRAATQKGGSAKPKDGNKMALPPIPIDGPEAIVAILEDAINRLRVAHQDGSIDAYTANAISNLSGKLMEAYKLIKVTGKLKEMQEAIDRFNRYGAVPEVKPFEESLDIHEIDLEVKPVSF